MKVLGYFFSYWQIGCDEKLSVNIGNGKKSEVHQVHGQEDR
jgi:hypothetical protein